MSLFFSLSIILIASLSFMINVYCQRIHTHACRVKIKSLSFQSNDRQGGVQREKLTMNACVGDID